MVGTVMKIIGMPMFAKSIGNLELLSISAPGQLPRLQHLVCRFLANGSLGSLDAVIARRKFAFRLAEL
jgi:hypothetical protein